MASSYAVALAEAAQAANALDAVHADCETFAAYALSNKAIAQVLANPVLSDVKKKDLVAKLAKEGSFSPLFLSFLNLLIQKRRIRLVDQVLVEFEAIYCKMSDTQARSCSRRARTAARVSGGRVIQAPPARAAGAHAACVPPHAGSHANLAAGRARALPGAAMRPPRARAPFAPHPRICARPQFLASRPAAHAAPAHAVPRQVATVTSAVKLENEQQFAIAKKLQEMTGAKNIKLKPVVDAALIGGFVVQFGKDGSGMIDLSIKGQMARLAQQLAPSQ